MDKREKQSVQAERRVGGKAKKFFVPLLIAVLAVGLLAGCSGESKQEKFTVYFGLNDATTGEQLLTVEEASKQIRAVFIEKGFGYTEYTAAGAYVEDGKAISNDTLVYVFLFNTKAEMNEVVNEAKQRLNLASVLIEEDQATYYFAQ